MAIIDAPRFRSCNDPDDPDDFRPASMWAPMVDPGGGDVPTVRSMSVMVDICAPGDRVPLHVHPIDEIVLLAEGTAEITLAADTRTVRAGAVMFVPAGVVHGGRAVGGGPATFFGVFPAEDVGIEYRERNPAPGTEADPPQPMSSADVRAMATSG